MRTTATEADSESEGYEPAMAPGAGVSYSGNTALESESEVFPDLEPETLETDTLPEEHQQIGQTTANAQPALSPWVSYLIVAALALIWGSSFILMKKGLVYYSAIEVGAFRITVAMLFLLPIALPRIKKVPKNKWGLLALSGLLGSFIPAFLFAVAGQHLTSAVSGSLNALAPLFTLLVGYLVFKTRVNTLQFWGIMIGLIGALALSMSRATPGAAFELNAWALLIVLATLMYAINLNSLKHNLPELDSLTISSVSMLTVGPFAMGYLLLGTPFLTHLQAGPAAYGPTTAIVVLGIFGTAIGLILFNRLLKYTSAVVASSVTYLMPAVAVGWGLVDGERILLPHYLGLACIFVGVLLVNRKRAKA
jgi:drug/metabolite transporter (DMT)-like permease